MHVHFLVTGKDALEGQSVPNIFLKHGKYKVGNTFGISVKHLVQCTAILHTGDGSNLVNANLLSPKL